MASILDLISGQVSAVASTCYSEKKHYLCIRSAQKGEMTSSRGIAFKATGNQPVA
ncbi:MAG: hypothetical protein IK031_02060 [Bacteroidales bacterium]|nr:hypothetical protein [Bacteroidales bacterium]